MDLNVYFTTEKFMLTEDALALNKDFQNQRKRNVTIVDIDDGPTPTATLIGEEAEYFHPLSNACGSFKKGREKHSQREQLDALKHIFEFCCIHAELGGEMYIPPTKEIIDIIPSLVDVVDVEADQELVEYSLRALSFLTKNPTVAKIAAKKEFRTLIPIIYRSQEYDYTYAAKCAALDILRNLVNTCAAIDYAVDAPHDRHKIPWALIVDEMSGNFADHDEQIRYTRTVIDLLTVFTEKNIGGFNTDDIMRTSLACARLCDQEINIRVCHIILYMLERGNITPEQFVAHSLNELVASLWEVSPTLVYAIYINIASEAYPDGAGMVTIAQVMHTLSQHNEMELPACCAILCSMIRNGVINIASEEFAGFGAEVMHIIHNESQRSRKYAVNLLALMLQFSPESVLSCGSIEEICQAFIESVENDGISTDSNESDLFGDILRAVLSLLQYGSTHGADLAVLQPIAHAMMEQINEAESEGVDTGEYRAMCQSVIDVVG